MAKYQKLIETKVIRTVHRITYDLHETAGGLMSALSNVPRDAKLIDADDEYAGDVCQCSYLVFEEERTDG